MNSTTIPIFMITLFLATFSPGPSMLLALNNGVKYGARGSLASSFGVTLAATIMGALSLAGFYTILNRFTWLFYLIKGLGAGYLIFLGLRIILSPVPPLDIRRAGTLPNRASFFRIFGEGFLVGMGNPKAILFFTAVFAQFLNLEQALAPQYSLMLISNGLITFICMTLYSIAGDKLLHLFRKPLVNILFNKITGGLFILLGVKVVLER